MDTSNIAQVFSIFTRQFNSGAGILMVQNSREKTDLGVTSGSPDLLRNAFFLVT
jgi:hypothetical protein